MHWMLINYYEIITTIHTIIEKIYLKFKEINRNKSNFEKLDEFRK